MPFEITHIGSINDDFVNNVQGIILANAQKIDSLVLNISSLGGSVSSGITAYNYLKKLPFPVRTHNLGEVSSAAILPYLAGKVRTAETISKFVIHPMEISFDGSVPYFKAEELLSNLSTDIQNYAGIVEAEVPSLKEKMDIIDLLKHQSFVITAEDALHFGIVTG